ncbi:MAG: hypothetical protein ACE5JO_14390, partial [Candidatus Binatia bacterium]
MKRPLRLILDKAMLRTMVDELENEPEFHQLVSETYSSLRDGHTKSVIRWERAVENFFRRSGFYIDIFEERTIGVDATFDNYRKAFQKRKTQVRYLAPMEFVRFAKHSMDFGEFQVRRFTADELELIFQNRISEIFYPQATIDMERLGPYWFVDVLKPGPPPLPPRRMPWKEMGRVGMKDTKYQRAIEPVLPVLQQLALFDWQADIWMEEDESLERGWRGFHIPFVLRIDDNLLGTLGNAPDLSQLEWTSVLDARTGEEEGEGPEVLIDLDENRTRSFKDFVIRVGNLLSGIKFKENNWEFLEVALGFFTKAFFSEGLEQMLWHIITLEAL